MSWNPFRKAREARELELEAADRWRVARKLADDDVTDLGEQLADLHVDGLDAILESASQPLSHERSTSRNKSSMAEAVMRRSIGEDSGPFWGGH